ncbi:hypothetical protein C900_02616 [Fulvivirga imtechensis AK7]|uniref:histidine kinase n=1 Tax=Fulvivirga imtechensis AK7 TaxID=1237149 RepID=L8JWT7_9BACT|nr:tetratricopeptide repeat-containing sensor histidine kinase [Fulvivirga imtechensis]ELR73531.1 hypothetical protein C900_02616 [Fulvivirga imtechensis AK7]
MKTLFTFIAFLVMPLMAFSQHVSHIDSLYASLRAVSGVDRVDVYNALAWEYRKSYPDSTIYYGNQALYLLKELKIEGKKAQSLNYIGIAYHYKGDQVRSFDYYHMAMDEAIQHGDSIQYAHSLNSLGRLFLTQGDFLKSYDYYFTALGIFEELNDQEGLSYSYKSLSDLYQTQNNYAKAQEMSEKAFNIRLATGNVPGQISMLIELAQIQEYNKNYEKAFDYYLQAKVKAESINDGINIASINVGIANLYFAQEKYPESLIFAKKALNLAGDTKNLHLVALIYLQLAKIYYEERDFALAELYFKQALKASEKSREYSLRQEAYYFLSEICKSRGDIACSYENFQHSVKLRQILNDAEAARSIERLESRLEIEKRERENELLKANQARDQAMIDRQRTYNVALIIIVLAVVSLVINLWITSMRRRVDNQKLQRKNDHIAVQREEITQQNRKINQQNKELQKHNKALAELNKEKDTLMNIVAHDLKSPFSRINGIGELLTLSGLNEEQRNYVALLKSIAQSGIDLIRDLLDVNAFEYDRRKPEISKVDLHDLLIEKMKGFYADAKSKYIELKMEGADSPVFIKSDKIYLSRILDNLISNAIKFSDPGKPVILKAGRSDNHVFISIKDFGQGFSDEDKIHIYQKFTKLSAQPTAGESSNGLGLAIVKTLVDRLGAEIELETEVGKGSEFTIKFTPTRQEVTYENLISQN